MNKEWLSYFGIRAKKKVDASRFDNLRSENHDNERIDKRLLINFPISSSIAKRKQLYQCHDITQADKRIAIRAYEYYCRTANGKFTSKKNNPKSYVQRMRDLQKKRLRRMLHNFGTNVSKRRLGPTVRTKSLDFSRYSPHFRCNLSQKQKMIRMRQLEYGLTKCARRLARKMRSCQVKLHKWDPLVIEAYSRRCQVLLDRMCVECENNVQNAETDSQPFVSIRRLTPDQIATALLVPEETLKHNALEVRVTRLGGQKNDLFSSLDHLICLDSQFYDVYRQGISEGRFEFSSQFDIDYQGHLKDNSYITMPQDVFRNPIFLTPESPSQQKTTLLEPEEINVPGDLSVTSTDRDSGDCCEIASLVSSSATSVVQSSDNSSFSLSFVNTRRKENTLSIAETKPVRVARNNSSFFRPSSYPLSSTESSRRFQSKQRSNQRALSECIPSRDKQSGRNSSSVCSIPRTSTRSKLKLWTVTKELMSPLLTRNRSKKFTSGVMMYINRSRSSSRSRSPRCS